MSKVIRPTKASTVAGYLVRKLRSETRQCMVTGAMCVRNCTRETGGCIEETLSDLRHALAEGAGARPAVAASDDMTAARVAWVRDLAKANMPYPGDKGLDGFAAGWEDGYAAGAAAATSGMRTETEPRKT